MQKHLYETVANPTLNILVGVQMGGLRFKNHTHKNQMLNSSKGALKSICYCLSIYITERFKTIVDLETS